MNLHPKASYVCPEFIFPFLLFHWIRHNTWKRYISFDILGSKALLSHLQWNKVLIEGVL